MNGTSCKTTKYKILTDSVKFHEFDMTHVSKSKNMETASKYYYLNFVKHFDYLESHTHTHTFKNLFGSISTI